MTDLALTRRRLPHRLLQPQPFFSGLTPTWTIDQLQTLTPWVTTNNSPSQDYTNPDDRSTTNIDSPGSQPTTVFLRTDTNPDDRPTTNIDSPGIRPFTVFYLYFIIRKGCP